MTEDVARQERQAEIENVALEIMRERGFDKMSMLAVAKRAKASNETLYRWYGDKHGLVIALATRVMDELVEQIRADIRCAPDDPRKALAQIAPTIIKATVQGPLTELDKAAATDRTGKLGEVIISHGRQVVIPLVQDIIQRGCDEGVFDLPSVEDASMLFLASLTRDYRTRLIFNQEVRITEKSIEERSKAAVSAFLDYAARNNVQSDNDV